MIAERGGSATADDPPSSGRARIPLWLVIAAPITLLVVAAVIVFAVATSRSSPDSDTVMRELCRSASEAQLAGRGVDDIEVSSSGMEVTSTGDAYRVQGTASFTEDGTVHHANLRCTIRGQDDAWNVTAVRVSG